MVRIMEVGFVRLTQMGLLTYPCNVKTLHKEGLLSFCCLETPKKSRECTQTIKLLMRFLWRLLILRFVIFIFSAISRSGTPQFLGNQLTGNCWFGSRWFGILRIYPKLTIPLIRGSQESKPPGSKPTITLQYTNMAMKIAIFIRRCIFKRSIFHCYVSLPECNH